MFCRTAFDIQKVVHTSTSEVWNSKVGSINEVDFKVNPLQLAIGADKIADFYLSFDLCSSCQPFNTYGPRQSARAVIPTIITQIASGRKK